MRQTCFVAKTLRALRGKMKKARDFADDGTIAIDEKSESLEEKVNLAKMNRELMRRAQGRIKKCKTANDVFGEFSRDAASGKVMEMHLALNSSDRQRAQESILDRSLGKAVDRTMSINMEISNLTEEEVENQIRDLHAEFSGGERKSSALLIDEKVVDRPEQTEELRTESGLSGEVHTVESPD